MKNAITTGCGRAGGRATAIVALASLAVTPLTDIPLSAQQRAVLPAQDESLELHFEELWSVGGAMATNEHELFGDLDRNSMGFDAEGNLYVFDRTNTRVVVFDREGDFVRQFGKEGEGPDEWQRPFQMSVFRDGTVVITDSGKWAFMKHGPDGGLLGRSRIDVTKGVAFGRFYPDPRGGAVYTGAGAGEMMMITRTGPGAGAPEESGRAVERWTFGGEEAVKEQFYAAWEAPDEGADEGRVISGGGARFRVGSFGPRRFEPALRMGSLSDGGLALVDSTGYRVKMIGPDGSLRRVIERPSLRPRPVDERVREQDLERRLAELEEGGGPQFSVRMTGGDGRPVPISQDQMRQMARNNVEQTRYYPEIPVVSSLAVGWGGTLWIERTPNEWWTDGPVDVVASNGTYLGTLRPDGPGAPHAFGPDGMVAYLEKDELDVATIKVRRLAGPYR